MKDLQDGWDPRLYDGSYVDPTFGVGTADWVQEQLMDQYLLNQADDDPNEREPGELDDVDDYEPPSCDFYDACGLRNEIQPD